MCGFTISKERLDNKIKHRGVLENFANNGEWDITFNSLPLCSYGLKIQQPLKVGATVLCFNGEIFNYKELDPRANSDLEYLYNVLKKENNINKLYKESLKWDGFWAIGFIKGKDIFFFTDPLGKKQLYYNHEGVSSEIKTFERKGHYQNYTEKNFGTFNTNFSNIKRAMPGNLYLYNIDNNLAYKKQSLDYLYSSNYTDLYGLIDLAVKNRLENKYDKISLLLSGGLDSSIILHHALKYCKDIDIVSIENGEKENVQKLQDQYNLDINYISDSYTDTDLDHAVTFYEYSLDYGSLIPNYLLFKNCKNSLVLTGDGADELFSGYARCLKRDTWNYDVFHELPYYHNIRLDRMSMMFTKEARSPLMSFPLLRYANTLRWEQRRDKKILRDLYKDLLPIDIVNGDKKPLRLKNDKLKNKTMVELTHKKICLNQKEK